MKRVAKHKHSAGLGRRTQGSGPLKRVRSTEDEDSPKGYRSPKPAPRRGAGRRALFAGNNGQSVFFDSLRRGNTRAFSLFNSALQPKWPHKALYSPYETGHPIPRQSQPSSLPHFIAPLLQRSLPLSLLSKTPVRLQIRTGVFHVFIRYCREWRWRRTKSAESAGPQCRPFPVRAPAGR